MFMEYLRRQLPIPGELKGRQGLPFRGRLYDKVTALSLFRRAFLAGLLPSSIRHPKIWPPLSGQTFGLCPPPSVDPAVVAGSEYLRDGEAFPNLWPGELRVFDEIGGEAFFRP